MKFIYKRKKVGILLLIFVAFGFGLYGKTIFLHLKRKLVFHIDVNEWMESRYTACGGQFTGYGNQFAVFRNMSVMPKDGEFCLSSGCLHSSGLSTYNFNVGKEGTHLNKWLTAIKQCRETSWGSKNTDEHRGVAIIVRRYEFLNLYHTMTDWYNVFLVMKLLNLSLSEVTIILMDGHQPGYFDTVWDTLFNQVVYWNTSRPMRFKQVVWNILGYESPMNYHKIDTLPFSDSFSNFFLQRYGYRHSKNLDCKNITVLFSFRRDYYFFPNTPIRVLKRKIANENELVKYFKTNYKNLHVLDLQLDQLPFDEQLKIITSTDLIISMHGAGLSHIMFMPEHSGVVELFPLYWTKFSTTHFRAFSRWRGLKYQAYQNWNSANEQDNYKTYIPPSSLDQNVRHVLSEMCGTI